MRPRHTFRDSRPLLLYMVGPPGAGKSTLMAELTRHCARMPATKPVGHEALLRRDLLIGAELGRRRAAFSGTDALAMNAQPAALRWIATRPYPLLLGEGARLGTPGFLIAARELGYRVLLVTLDGPEEVLEARRRQRGSGQNPSWVKGASTRARRLSGRVGLDVATQALPATAAPAALAAHVIGMDPTLEVLRNA